MSEVNLKTCSVSPLGGISTLRGSRPDWTIVIVELFLNWKVGPCYAVFTLCNMVASCCIQKFLVAMLSDFVIILCLHGSTVILDRFLG